MLMLMALATLLFGSAEQGFLLLLAGSVAHVGRAGIEEYVAQSARARAPRSGSRQARRLSAGHVVARQPRAPEREEADGEDRAGPVQVDEHRDRLGRPASTAPIKGRHQRQAQDPRGEAGAEQPGAGTGDPTPVDKEVVGEGEAENDERAATATS